MVVKHYKRARVNKKSIVNSLAIKAENRRKLSELSFLELLIGIFGLLFFMCLFAALVGGAGWLIYAAFKNWHDDWVSSCFSFAGAAVLFFIAAWILTQLNKGNEKSEKEEDDNNEEDERDDDGEEEDDEN